MHQFCYREYKFCHQSRSKKKKKKKKKAKKKKKKNKAKKKNVFDFIISYSTIFTLTPIH